MKNILVTGGAGFIGSNFVRHILAALPELCVVNLDALTYAGSRENLRRVPDANHIFVEGDIADFELVCSLLLQHEIDTIVHFAAESHVDRSIHSPGEFLHTNVIGTFQLLEAARKVWLQNKICDRAFRFHHISTDEVFGSLNPSEPAFSETTPYAPNSPYAASKAASDHLVRSYGHTYGLPFVVSNCSNNYGPYQYPEKLIPLVILNALGGKPLPIYGDGRQVRDWLHVQDHCEAIERILHSGELGETYNIGGGVQLTNLELVLQLCTILDEFLPGSRHRPHEKLIHFVPDRPGHDLRYAMDTTKVQTRLGWQPKYSLAEGLRLTVEWYIKNPSWVEAVRKNPSFSNWLDINYSHRGDG